MSGHPAGCGKLANTSGDGAVAGDRASAAVIKHSAHKAVTQAQARNDTLFMLCRHDLPRPTAPKDRGRLLSVGVLAFSLACFGAAPAPAGTATRLVWRAPAGSARWTGLSTVNVTVTYAMSSVLKAMAGHRADPVYVIEERTRTFSAGTAPGEIDINDQFSRKHGGTNPTDTTVKTRTRKQILQNDASGQTGLEPYLCKAEPPLNDTDPDPKTFAACSPAVPIESRRYEDPGDAALDQLPAGPVAPGASWTFTRAVIVGREFASGTITYVDTLQRIDQRSRHQIAVIDVAGTGRVDLAPDLQARGFHTGTMTFAGTGEFDLTAGSPGTQHYTGHADWHASILGANIGLALDEVYEGKAWSAASS